MKNLVLETERDSRSFADAQEDRQGAQDDRQDTQEDRQGAQDDRQDILEDRQGAQKDRRKMDKSFTI